MKRDDAPGGVAAWSARLYRALLLLFPASFRRAYGDEMARAFRDLCRDAWRTSGAGGVLALWPGALGDLLLAASAEHVGGLTMLRLTLVLSLAAPALFALDNLVYLIWAVLLGDPPDFMTDVAIYGFIGWLGLAVVAWLVGAFVAARQGRWGWFALTLCLPYAGSLLYSVLESIAPPRGLLRGDAALLECAGEQCGPRDAGQPLDGRVAVGVTQLLVESDDQVGDLLGELLSRRVECGRGRQLLSGVGAMQGLTVRSPLHGPV